MTAVAAATVVLMTVALAQAGTRTWLSGAAIPGQTTVQADDFLILTGTFTEDNESCHCHTVGAGATGVNMAVGNGSAFHSFSDNVGRSPQARNYAGITIQLNAHYNF